MDFTLLSCEFLKKLRRNANTCTATPYFIIFFSKMAQTCFTYKSIDKYLASWGSLFSFKFIFVIFHYVITGFMMSVLLIYQRPNFFIPKLSVHTRPY